MAKQQNEDKDTKSLGFFSKLKRLISNEITSFILGIFLLMFSIYLFIPYLSFFVTGEADQSLVDSVQVPTELDNPDIKNMGGYQGAQMAHWLINRTFGLSSVFILIFMAVAGLRLMKVRRFRMWRWFISCSTLLIWFSLFFGFFFYTFYKDSHIYLGGQHGYYVSQWLVSQIGTAGLVILLLVTGLYIAIYFNKGFIDKIRSFFKGKYFPNVGKLKLKKNKKDESFTDEELDEKEELTRTHDSQDIDLTPHNEEEEYERAPNNEPIDLGVVAPTPKESRERAVDFHVEAPKNKTQPQPNTTLTGSEPNFEVETIEDDLVTGSLSQPYNPKLDLEHYKFPTLDLMKFFENNEPTVNMEEQKMNKDKIINTLRSFGIEITTIKATVGPTVTLYEITPEQGVRISKIRGLEDDIALSLAALGIRIIAPIPGKGTIGIEVPNESPKIVSGQSIIGSKKFQACTYDLPIALGKTITNEVFMMDLCKMPHVLVAGATGQGKSVGLNTIITSLLYKKHPAELKFVLIDPKKVEFSIYSAIQNHYLAQLPDAPEPIITDVTKVVQTLNSVCVEMDSRYDLLKIAQVRNIKEYNDKFINRRLNPEKGHKFMPYIVVIIDEFGDLIMTAGKEIELPIARIAQLARAVGIHMVIATQRPTTNIITGTIKANFPARVAFRVSSMMDSRTILDRPGANQLIGKGDMLFLQGADPIRVQCAFIDTPEVENITKYIAQQQGYTSPFYLPEYTSDEAKAALGEVDPAQLDPLFEEAARMIVIHQQGSTSLIQRKFSIGYNRAGRIMDQLEKMGVVGPSEGSKARQVLCQDEIDLEQRLNN